MSQSPYFKTSCKVGPKQPMETKGVGVYLQHGITVEITHPGERILRSPFIIAKGRILKQLTSRGNRDAAPKKKKPLPVINNFHRLFAEHTERG